MVVKSLRNHLLFIINIHIIFPIYLGKGQNRPSLIHDDYSYFGA